MTITEPIMFSCIKVSFKFKFSRKKYKYKIISTDHNGQNKHSVFRYFWFYKDQCDADSQRYSKLDETQNCDQDLLRIHQDSKRINRRKRGNFFRSNSDNVDHDVDSYKHEIILEESNYFNNNHWHPLENIPFDKTDHINLPTMRSYHFFTSQMPSVYGVANNVKEFIYYRIVFQIFDLRDNNEENTNIVHAQKSKIDIGSHQNHTYTVCIIDRTIECQYFRDASSHQNITRVNTDNTVEGFFKIEMAQSPTLQNAQQKQNSELKQRKLKLLNMENNELRGFDRYLSVADYFQDARVDKISKYLLFKIFNKMILTAPLTKPLFFVDEKYFKHNINVMNVGVSSRVAILTLQEDYIDINTHQINMHSRKCEGFEFLMLFFSSMTLHTDELPLYPLEVFKKINREFLLLHVEAIENENFDPDSFNKCKLTANELARFVKVSHIRSLEINISTKGDYHHPEHFARVDNKKKKYDILGNDSSNVNEGHKANGGSLNIPMSTSVFHLKYPPDIFPKVHTLLTAMVSSTGKAENVTHSSHDWQQVSE